MICNINTKNRFPSLDQISKIDDKIKIKNTIKHLFTNTKINIKILNKNLNYKSITFSKFFSCTCSLCVDNTLSSCVEIQYYFNKNWKNFEKDKYKAKKKLVLKYLYAISRFKYIYANIIEKKLNL